MWDLIVSVPDHCLSFYFECLTLKLLQKLPALGGRLVSCLISIQGIKFELHAGALPICYPRPFYRNSKNIAFRTVNVLTFHKTLRLKDSCSNSDCFRD